jgi:hypothetical protein
MKYLTMIVFAGLGGGVLGSVGVPWWGALLFWVVVGMVWDKIWKTIGERR